MKKLLSFALILMVCCTSALIFAGCESTVPFLVVSAGGTATEVIDNQGRVVRSYNFALYTGEEVFQSRYEREQVDQVKVTCYVEKGSSEILNEVSEKSLKELLDTNRAHIRGFNLGKVGTRTATVTYNGSTATFQYVVA